MDELQVFDKNLKRTGYLVDADQVTRTRKINSDYELTFRVPMNSDDYNKIQLKGHVKDERGQFYVINSRQRDRSDARRMAMIHCMHVMFKLSDFKFPYESYIEESFGVNISTITDLISAATGGKFTFSIDDSFDLKDVKDFGRGNCLQTLNEIIKLYECEMEPDNFVIHLKKKIGNTSSELQYRLKKNIISNSFTDDTRALVTRMYSQMKDGLTFIGIDASNLTTEEFDLLNAIPGAIEDGKLAVNYLISPYAASWANTTNTYFDGEIILQDIEDPLELLEATRTALRENEVPQLDINVKAADLFKIDHTEPKPNLGDTVVCIDSGMEINNIEARIIELMEYPFDRSRHSDVNLANFMKRDFEDIIADLDRSKRIVDDLISGGKVRATAFEEFAKQAVIDINNSKSEVLYDDRGIVLQSKSNPLYQVIHSSVGTILTTDGGETARVAITAEGIAAPYIVGILGEFAQVKTDNLIAGDALISSAIIESLKVEKLDASTAKIAAAMIESLVVGGNVTMGPSATIAWDQVTSKPSNIINPNYIQSTYIDSTSILSPTITAGILTGSLIRTAAAGVYPRIEFDSSGLLLRAYSAANKYININPFSSSSVPSLELWDNDASKAVLHYLVSSGYQIVGVGGTPITITSSLGSINLNAGTYVDVGSWSKLRGTSSRTLQQELTDFQSDISDLQSAITALWAALSGKSDIGHTHTVTISNHNHGLTTGANIATVGGGSAGSFASSGGGTYTTST